MNPKVDPAELGEIVEETARLEEADRALLEDPEVRAVLRELDLPDGRLDEARRVIAARKEAARTKRRRLLFGAGATLLCATLAGALALRARTSAQALARVGASTTTLRVAGAPISGPLARAARPEIELAAVLTHTPEGAGVELTCDWNGPTGEARHQNRWHTKPVDKDLWPTHCQHAFGPADAAGPWSVTLRQAERPLATERFVLE